MGSLVGISDVIHEIGETVRKVVPDADKRLDIDLRLAELSQNLQLAQIDVNKAEAASSNLFVAGWRPSIGWVCSAALAYTWIVAPLVQYGVNLFGLHTALPALPPDSIFPVVTAMLGISVSRTVEKMNGVATSVGGAVLQPLNKADTPAVTPYPKVKQPKQKGWFQ